MKLEKDCCFTYGNHWFRYRVGAVIIEDGCILLAKNENSEDDYYYSVGGGVHINEKADEAIEREIFEETGVHYEVERLVFVHENFFSGIGSLKEYDCCHEISFYYLCKPRGTKELDCHSFVRTRMGTFKENMYWIPISDLDKYKAFPTFYKTELKAIPDGVKYIVTDERIKKDTVESIHHTSDWKRNKEVCAQLPPMGWNSWDCYGAAVNEEQLKGNAVYMAEHLKKYGWEYIVCDIQWYEPQAVSTEYNDFYPLEMDRYARLIPAVNRFPSAKDGVGFQKIAAFIHGLGLKFGIHMMRGIPRQAVHAAIPIKGSTKTARDIAQKFSVCPWNTDMYGVNPDAEGAQEYYDSVFELYASWGIDFVKVDDIANTEFDPQHPYSAKKEIEMIRKAIDRSGRAMVLSLSPGPAVLSEAAHLSQNANMWRMTGDFWDNWEQLYQMFTLCRQWSPYVGNGCWPDCDMLPLGHIGLNTPGHDQNARYTNFTKDEQITMMTLWCIFRSPLMMGGELRDNDAWTRSLLTNQEVLALLAHSYGAREYARTNDTIIWRSEGDDQSIYLAVFNVGEYDRTITVALMDLLKNKQIESGYYNGDSKEQGSTVGEFEQIRIRDLWRHQTQEYKGDVLSAEVAKHGARLFKLML